MSPTSIKNIRTMMGHNKRLFANFSYLTILEIFILVAPLITYPYLVNVLGRELYGWVIIGQITASYCTVLIDFGFKRISARHIATSIGNREKMSEAISTILILRCGLWILSLILYSVMICMIASYREHLQLFLFSFLTTLSSVLFLDFYFQGIEDMKYITIINIIVRGLFVAATFFVIKVASDYIYVPLLWSVGYILGGIISIWVVFFRHKISFILPSRSIIRLHLREGFIIFISDAMLTIKDKLNYSIMGALIGMSDIVIYDIGSKISGLLQKPVAILCTVMFPGMAKHPSVARAKKTMTYIFIFSLVIVFVTNIFLPWIVKFFINEEVDVFAIRIYTLAPIILGVSVFLSSNVFFAFGKDKLVLKSTYVTTIAYVILLAVMYFIGALVNVMSFVILTISAYLIELIYRLLISREILRAEK